VAEQLFISQERLGSEELVRFYLKQVDPKRNVRYS
jgi:hypothetical protein